MGYYTDTIKASVSMLDLAERYDLGVGRDGFCPCPFHSEKTASFKCYPEDRGFYCFGCHAAGSVIDFVMKYFGMDYMAAVGKLNDDFSLNLPIDRKPTLRDKYRSKKRPNRRLMEREALERRESEAEGRWIKADQLVQSLAPTSTDDISDAFRDALAERDRAAELWRQAEVNLYEFNRQNDSGGAARP